MTKLEELHEELRLVDMELKNIEDRRETILEAIDIEREGASNSIELVAT